MKYLFVVAMEKEANDIINYYKLDKIYNNYYKRDKVELIITNISRNGIISSLIWLSNNYKLNYDEYIMINVGMVGSNNLKIGSVLMVENSYGYHFDLTPFGDKLYHAANSPFKMDTIDNINKVDCYTSDGFVTKTDIKEDVIFDMELNAIVNFPFKKQYSIKIVSDSLNDNEYNNFSFNDATKDIFYITDKIIQDK